MRINASNDEELNVNNSNREKPRKGRRKL